MQGTTRDGKRRGDEASAAERGRETGRQINNCINGVNDKFCKLVQRGLTATEATESRDEPQSFLLVFSLMDDTTIALSMLLLFLFRLFFISLSSHLFPLGFLIKPLFLLFLFFSPIQKVSHTYRSSRKKSLFSALGDDQTLLGIKGKREKKRIRSRDGIGGQLYSDIQEGAFFLPIIWMGLGASR